MNNGLKRILALLLAFVMTTGCFCAFAAADDAVSDSAVSDSALSEAALSDGVASADAVEEDPMALYRTGSPWICSNIDGVLTEEIAEGVSRRLLSGRKR